MKEIAQRIAAECRESFENARAFIKSENTTKEISEYEAYYADLYNITNATLGFTNAVGKIYGYLVPNSSVAEVTASLITTTDQNGTITDYPNASLACVTGPDPQLPNNTGWISSFTFGFQKDFYNYCKNTLNGSISLLPSVKNMECFGGFSWHTVNSSTVGVNVFNTFDKVFEPNHTLTCQANVCSYNYSLAPETTLTPPASPSHAATIAGPIAGAVAIGAAVTTGAMIKYKYDNWHRDYPNGSFREYVLGRRNTQMTEETPLLDVKSEGKEKSELPDLSDTQNPWANKSTTTRCLEFIGWSK